MTLKKTYKKAKDASSGRKAKYSTIIQTEEDKPTIYYDTSAESKKRRSLTQAGLEFATSYYNSPGFKERLEKHNKSLESNKRDGDYAYYPTENLFLKGINYSVGADGSKDLPGYNRAEGIVHVGTSEIPDKFKSATTTDLNSIIAHEIGHAIDRSMNRTHKPTGAISNGMEMYGAPINSLYTASYPIFQNNKNFKNKIDKAIQREIKSYEEYLGLKTTNPDAVKNSSHKLTDRKVNVHQKDYKDIITEDVTQRLVNKIGSTNTNTLLGPMDHDAASHESYADYISFLYNLYEKGIHDARKSNADGSNEFTKEKLQQFKEATPNWEKMRIFEKFSDEDLIEMANVVADNNTKKKRYSLEEVNLA